MDDEPALRYLPAEQNRVYLPGFRPRAGVSAQQMKLKDR